MDSLTADQYINALIIQYHNRHIKSFYTSDIINAFKRDHLEYDNLAEDVVLYLQMLVQQHVIKRNFIDQNGTVYKDQAKIQDQDPNNLTVFFVFNEEFRKS